MQDSYYSTYRNLTRPMIIYNLENYQVLMVGEYEHLVKLIEEFKTNSQRYNIGDAMDNVTGIEINCSQSEFNQIVTCPGYLENYINNNIENFLNSIIKK